MYFPRILQIPVLLNTVKYPHPSTAGIMNVKTSDT